MTQDSDPVGDKFVDSLAHPGGNITGLTNVSLEVTGKRLELLRDSVAGLSHVMVLGNSANRANAQVLKDTQNAAQALRLKLEYHDMQRAEDAESAFKAAAKAGARALLVLQTPSQEFTAIESYSWRSSIVCLRCITAATLWREAV
jgi:putative ABC transport system substrate-binding protein